MKICKVCKTENDEKFNYCKNCGTKLEVPPPPQSAQTDYNQNINSQGLVCVRMVLPDPINPEVYSVQTVYVTPAQKAAIQYDAAKHGKKI